MPGSQKFTSNLHEISHLICVITSGRCLEKSSDFKHCFGLDIGATVEPGHRVNIHTYIYFIYARNLQSSCRANIFEKIS